MLAAAPILCRETSPPGLTFIHPNLQELRVSAGRGWWEIWDDGHLISTIPPTRRCLAWALAERWQTNPGQPWTPRPLTPRFWFVGQPEPAVEAPEAHNIGPSYDISGVTMKRIAGQLTDAILAPLQDALEPEVQAVWKRLGSCAPLTASPHGRCAPLESWFWDHPFLARDVLNHRGAAMVVRAMMETCDDPDMAPAWETLQSGDWIRPCSFWSKGTPYRALRVTMSNCPGGLPVRSLSVLHLRGVRLPRPRRTRMELITAMAVGRHHLGHGSSPNTDLLLEADEALLRRALPPMQADLHDMGTLTPVEFLDYQVADILCFPDACPDLMTLAYCSAEWHVIGHLNPHPSLLGMAPAVLVKPTAAPPVELPAKPGRGVTLRRLATIGEVIEEGKDMHHCVGQYAHRAVAGFCFLYHVECKGTRATVELDRSMHLVQARGPRNGENAATRWARERLPAIRGLHSLDPAIEDFATPF